MGAVSVAANNDDIMPKRSSVPPAVLRRELDGESVLLNLDRERLPLGPWKSAAAPK
jgi:hypothetical protein